MKQLRLLISISLLNFILVAGPILAVDWNHEDIVSNPQPLVAQTLKAVLPDENKSPETTNKAQEVSTSKPIQGPKLNSIQAQENPNSAPTITSIPTTAPQTPPTQPPTTPPRPTTPPLPPPPTNTPPPPPPSNRCIIMIQGAKYDVTDFRSIHSGGDIFQCGTDMTQVFFSQHNQNTLNLMQKYRV